MRSSKARRPSRKSTVLRLSRERLLVSLAPGEVALVRVQGRLRPRIADKAILACDPQFGAEPWQGAVAALEGAAKALHARPLEVTVVLSNHFVRYATLPWSDALDSAEEELAYAQHGFTRIYGERAKAWTLRVTDAPAGAPRLASAIDAALIDALRGCFPKGAKARLVSVQPYLMSAVNRWRGEIPAKGAWLVLVEPERACLALQAKGRWQAVQSMKGAFQAPEDWVALLERERLRIEADSPETVLVRTAAANRAWPKFSGWSLRALALPPLTGFRPLEDERYALALAGA
jgi:hypothetical protein